MLLTFEDPPQNIKVHPPLRVFPLALTPPFSFSFFHHLPRVSYPAFRLHVPFHVVNSAHPCEDAPWEKHSLSLSFERLVSSWVRFA